MRSLSYDDLFIAGRWQAPSTTRRLSVISPHTEEPIGEVPDAAPEDVDRAIAAAREAFDNGPWPRLSPFERIEKIEKLAAICGDRHPKMIEYCSTTQDHFPARAIGGGHETLAISEQVKRAVGNRSPGLAVVQ